MGKLIQLKEIDNSSFAISFCEKFKKSPEKRYILGCNVFSSNIADQVEIVGFIDDYSTESGFCNKPIFKSRDIPDDSLVVVAVLGRPFTALNSLEAYNFLKLDYFSFELHSGLSFDKMWFNISFKDDALINYSKYNEIYEKLYDAESKRVFQKLYNFRTTFNLTHLKGFEDIQYRQYFEGFLQYSANEVFVDVGGYDGKTSLDFIDRCNEYDFIHIIEPDDLNFKRITDRFLGYDRVAVHNFGVSNVNESLRFTSQGISSRFCIDGEMEVELTRLDDLIKDEVSFVKMDIEGFEYFAIEGALNLIKRHKPKLAICTYHNPSDVWRITNLVLSVHNDYKLYFRHYNEGISESVMFFIP